MAFYVHHVSSEGANKKCKTNPNQLQLIVFV